MPPGMYERNKCSKRWTIKLKIAKYSAQRPIAFREACVKIGIYITKR